MKNYSSILILAASCIIALHYSSSRADERPAANYGVEAGRIMIYSGDTVRVIPIGGTIEQHCQGDDGIYYITIKVEGSTGVVYVGFVESRSGEIRFEKKLPVSMEEFTVKKFAAAGGIAYVLGEPRAASKTGRILNRIDLNSMEVSRVSNVLDFQLNDRDLVVMAKNGVGVELTMNETSVPVTLMGEGLLGISKVINGRIVFVTNGEETEIIDIRSGRGLYQYSNNKEFLMPEEYNLTLQIKDGQGSEQDDREMVFYKVFIDGVESGRTDSGPARLSREFRTKVDANKYHLIKLERWALNSAKGRYDRENNIRQPKTEHIFIPMNRVVKLSVLFDGKGYHYGIIPVYK